MVLRSVTKVAQVSVVQGPKLSWKCLCPTAGLCTSFRQSILQNSYVLIPRLDEGQYEQSKVNGLENYNKTSQHRKNYTIDPKSTGG